MNIFEKLMKIQSEVRVTKDLRNDFGKFRYRSAEMIYEETKPICARFGAVIRVTDDVVLIGDKPYVKAVAELIDVEMQGKVYSIASVGWARIPESKKGMDDSQITGSSSSYARKYALGGLLCLDDNKDPDSMDNSDKDDNTARYKNNAEDMETYRFIEDTVEIRANDGKFYDIKKFNKAQLRQILKDDKFEGIRNFVEDRLKILK